MVRVLIIEDEPLVIKMYEKELTADGFEVIPAVGGKAGIEKAKKEKPDIIVMDIMMPGMDGIEATQIIKSDSETKEIPIVMLTNLSGSRDEELALAKGAVKFLVKKDIKPHDLGKILQEILKERKTS